jgi:autotransporter-associated beta strand protein
MTALAPAQDKWPLSHSRKKSAPRDWKNIATNLDGPHCRKSEPVCVERISAGGASRMRAYLLATTASVALLTATAHGQDATWLGGGQDFSDPRNWSPPVVPTGTAFFGPTASTSLFFFETTNVGGFTFNPGAPNYSFNFDVPGRPNSVTFTGAGILNNSSSVPRFSLTENNALLSFRNSSTAANASINIERLVAVPGTQPPTLMFNDTSTAGAANIVNTRGIIDFNGNSSAGTATINSAILAQVNFNNFSSADRATIINGLPGFPSSVTFNDSSSAGSANITNNVSLLFGDSSSAGSANITNNAALLFAASSTAGNAIVHTTNGGLTQFQQNASGGQARIITDAGGTFDINALSQSGLNPLTVGSIEGTGTYQLRGRQLITGTNDLSTTVSGEITGTGGSLVKTGSGTLTLAGSNSYTSQTIVQNGTLVVDGSIAKSSLMTVQGGARLGGSGTVGSTIIASFGNLAPGPSETPGAMTVAGNLAFQTGALYIVQVNPTAASTTNITGTAALTGIVGANFAPGSYTRRSYTILSAAEGRTGTFDLVLASGLPVGFQASLSYTDNTVVLDLASQLARQPGQSVGQLHVSTAIDRFFNNGGVLPPAFLPLFGLTGSNLSNALSQLSGEAATGAQKVGFQLTDQFLNLMLDPFVDGRSGVGGADHPALGFAPERASMPPDIALAYASVLKGPRVPTPLYEPRWTVWGGAYGGSNRTTGDLAMIGSHDLSARTVGFAGGFDYRLTPDTVVGLAFAGGGTDWSLSQGLGGGRSDAFQAGVYGATKSGPAYLAAAFVFTNHWMSTDRLAFGDHLTADFNAQSYGGRLEGGYRFGTPYGGITPYAAIQAQNFHTPGYTETGLIPNGFAHAFGSRDATDTRSELGARFDRVLAVYQNAVLALRGRVAWAHDWVSDATLTPVFQSLPGASFIVNGVAPAQNSALTSAGAELRLANRVTLLAKFDGEFASHSSTYGGTGTFRYRW